MHVVEDLRREQQSHDLGRRDRHDGEVVGAQSQGRDTEDQREDRRREQTDEHADPPRAMPKRQDRDRVAVAAEGHEAGHTEVEQAGVAEVHGEAGRRERVGDRDRAQDVAERVRENCSPIHGRYPNLSLRPSKP